MLGLLATPYGARAWGPQGHRVAGALTEPLLSPHVAAVVKELLGDESLADVSTWADRMRDNPSDFWQRQAGPYHYVTVPPGKTYAQVAAPAKGDSVTALASFRQTLQDPDAPRVQKQLALRFSIHIIQDLHQPLHVGNGRDRGGNDIKLKVNGRRSNLHRVWDSSILRSKRRSDREWVTALGDLSEAQRKAWHDPHPETWIAESAGLRDQIYPRVDRVDAVYFEQYLPMVTQRLQQSAVRTSAWLQAVLIGERVEEGS